MNPADRGIKLDFITHPEWDGVIDVFNELIAQFQDRAARCTAQEHDLERGRLLGAERALACLVKWRADQRQELSSGRSEGRRQS